MFALTISKEKQEQIIKAASAMRETVIGLTGSVAVEEV